MPNEILQKVGTQLRFCVAGSYSPTDPATDFTIGTPTDVVLTLSGIANGAARQSNKADLGATRAAAFEIQLTVDFTGETPSATGRVDLYWMPSTSGTAGTGNVGGGAGVDAAFPSGSEPGTPTLAELLTLIGPCYVGSLFTHDGGVVQNGFIGVLRPTNRYGQWVLVNNAGDAFEADNVEMALFMTPIVDEVQ